MRNLINLLLCGLILLVFAKCNMHNNKSAQTVQQQEASEQNVTQKEDFNTFIVRFHSDSIFRISRCTELFNQRLSFYKCLPEYNEELGRRKIGETSDALSITGLAYYNNLFQKIYEFQNDSIVFETLQFETGDSLTSSYIHCKYKLNNGLWIIESFDFDVDTSLLKTK